MEIWLTVFIPIVLSIIAVIWFNKKVTWWEAALPTLATILIIIIFKAIGTNSVTKDYEYWGNYVTEVRWYQEWDEWIEQTCTRSVPCGTDKDGNTQYCTETYDCSYRQHHPEYWEIILNDGNSVEVSENYYNHIKKQFGTSSIFVDMNRDYYRIDGDMYKNLYPNQFEKFEFYATKHTYTNKVQCSQSVYNYPSVTPDEVKKYKLYDYPEIKDNDLPAVLAPFYITSDIQKKFDYLNGMLGMTKQVRVWILIYESQDRNTAYMQESYWKGGNKNEFVVTIGVDKNKKILWSKVFSWTEVVALKIKTERSLVPGEKLNLLKLSDEMFRDIASMWKRKNFEDFDYLTVPVPSWAIIVSIIISFLSTIGILMWVTVNEFENPDTPASSFSFSSIVNKVSNWIKSSFSKASTYIKSFIKK